MIDKDAVIEEMAGWLARLTSSDDAWDTWFCEEDRIAYRQKAQELAAIARRGWVRLSADQSLPICPYQPVPDIQWEQKITYEEAQQDMLKAGFRRVEG